MGDTLTTKVLNFLMSTSISKNYSIVKISAFLFFNICMKILKIFFNLHEISKYSVLKKIGTQVKHKTIYTSDNGQILERTKEIQ